MTRRALIVAVCLLIGFAAAARAADHTADRFDSRIEVLRGGTLKVTETLVFRFDKGSRQIVREISSHNTDGIDVVSATMDGVTFPRGSGSGAIEITGRSPVRVRWRFQPVSSSSHTFELTYRVKGAARQDDDADVVEWRALPHEHSYRIASATIDIELPAQPSSGPTVDTHRTDAPLVEAEDTHVRIRARDLRSNAWLEPSIRLPRGSVLDSPPEWQQRALHAEAAAPAWATAAGIVLIAGFILLFAIHQSYDAPPRDGPLSTPVPAAPDTLPPAIAGALVTDGRPHLEHAMAALFGLADRGELAITEGPRSLGQRTFVVARTRTGRPLAGHEQRALEIIFGSGDSSSPVSLAKARARLARRLRAFATAVDAEMTGAGLIDNGRRATRTHYRNAAIAALVLAVAGAPALAPLVGEYLGWPMLIPAASGIVALTALICHLAHTAFSNDAVRRGREWRGFQKYLTGVSRDRAHAPGHGAAQLLPFAVALGLGPAWSKYLKHHHARVPPWFHGVAPADSGEAFAVFVAVGGAGMSKAH